MYNMKNSNLVAESSINIYEGKKKQTKYMQWNLSFLESGRRCLSVSYYRWMSVGIHQLHTFILVAGQSVQLNGIVTTHFRDVLTGPYAIFNGYRKAAMCSASLNMEPSLSTLSAANWN